MDIKDYISYNPKTGKLYWIKAPYRNTKVGAECGTLDKTLGYVKISFNYKSYSAHRVAFFLQQGEWPSKHVDHINGDRSDNRFCNLRLVSQSQNNQNQPIHRSGRLVGASFDKKTNKWLAMAPFNFLNRVEKKQKYLGRFLTEQEAHAAVVNHCGGSL